MQILQLLRLRQINNGVFVQLNKATINMLRIAEPQIAWGYPSMKTVHDLVNPPLRPCPLSLLLGWGWQIYKRGYGKVHNRRVPITDNSIIERALGGHDIICVEDLVNHIYGVGPAFKNASNFLWPFKAPYPYCPFLSALTLAPCSSSTPPTAAGRRRRLTSWRAGTSATGRSTSMPSSSA